MSTYDVLFVDDTNRSFNHDELVLFVSKSNIVYHAHDRDIRKDEGPFVL